jgi:hypothetical protein
VWCAGDGGRRIKAFRCRKTASEQVICRCATRCHMMCLCRIWILLALFSEVVRVCSDAGNGLVWCAGDGGRRIKAFRCRKTASEQVMCRCATRCMCLHCQHLDSVLALLSEVVRVCSDAGNGLV